MKRGFSLVELMVAVSILGIIGLLFDTVAGHVERTGLAEVQRERARLLVEYHARQASRGHPVVATVDEALRAELRGVTLSRERRGRVVTVSARWSGASGADEQLALSVFAGGDR